MYGIGCEIRLRTTIEEHDMMPQISLQTNYGGLEIECIELPEFELLLNTA
jgi:hypothetical protein